MTALRGYIAAEICFEKDKPNARAMTKNKGRDLMVFIILEKSVDHEFCGKYGRGRK